jgi:uncharacterized RDD family membrane protein YckC
MFGRRALAFLIDIASLGIVGMALQSAIGPRWPAIALGLTIYVAYFAWFWTRAPSRTPGMRLLGLGLASEVGENRIGLSRALVRIGVLVAPAATTILVDQSQISRELVGVWGIVIVAWLLVLAVLGGSRRGRRVACNRCWDPAVRKQP